MKPGPSAHCPFLKLLGPGWRALPSMEFSIGSFQLTSVHKALNPGYPLGVKLWGQMVFSALFPKSIGYCWYGCDEKCLPLGIGFVLYFFGVESCFLHVVGSSSCGIWPYRILYLWPPLSSGVWEASWSKRHRGLSQLLLRAELDIVNCLASGPVWRIPGVMVYGPQVAMGSFKTILGCESASRLNTKQYLNSCAEGRLDTSPQREA